MERDSTGTATTVRTWPAAWRAGVAAALAGGVVLLISAATGVDLVVRTGSGAQTVGLVDVIVAALVATLLGWAARTVILRLTGDGRRAWWVLCVAVGLVSLLGPLAATTVATTSYLVAAHVSVGSAIAVGLARPERYPPRRR